MFDRHARTYNMVFSLRHLGATVVTWTMIIHRLIASFRGLFIASGAGSETKSNSVDRKPGARLCLPVQLEDAARLALPWVSYALSPSKDGSLS